MIKKLDAHQHFWDLKQFHYPWLTPATPVLYHNFEPAALEPELNKCSVHGTIVVQATHSQAETEWFLSLAQTTPFIKGVVGWLNLASADFLQQLDTLQAKGPLCGLRHQVHDEPDPAWLLQPKVITSLRTLAAKDLPYDLLLRPNHLVYLPKLFEAVPNGSWVIDHFAKPEIKNHKLEPWLASMKTVAQYPNVYCKLSGLITEADHRNWTVEDIRVYFEHVLALFGPERILFGSDWPVCLLAGSYVEVHNLVSQLLSTLTSNEQAAIWAGTASKVYRVAV